MYPALAVARALRDAQPGLELAYVGGVRGLERRIVAAQAELPYHELMVRSLRSGGVNAHLVLDPLRLAASVPQAWRLLGRLRPRAVFTSGGYLGIPLVMAARARGIPSLVWEGNVVAGPGDRGGGPHGDPGGGLVPADPGDLPRPRLRLRHADPLVRRHRSPGRAPVLRGRPGRPAAARLRRLAGGGPHHRRPGRRRWSGCCPTGACCTSPGRRAWPRRRRSAHRSAVSWPSATSRSPS